MGFLDSIKSKISQNDDQLDDMDVDSDQDDDSSSGSSGGAFGFAKGFLKKASSGIGGGGEDGGFGSLLGKVKGMRKLKIGSQRSGSDDDTDDDDLGDGGLDELDLTGDDDDEGEQPIRRSGIAAKLDGNADADTTKEKEENVIPTPVTAGGMTMDLDSLFEDEFVFNPTLKDLAESLDNISAVDLAADLRTFLEDIQ